MPVIASRPSKKQRELLSFIEGFIAGHGYGPSYREVMRALDYKSVSTVAIHINGLIAKGYLQKRDRSARSLEVIKAPDITPTFTVATVGDEKWLVDSITKRFNEYQSTPTDKAYDDLCVLVGALHVLGISGAAGSFSTKLRDIRTKKR